MTVKTIKSDRGADTAHFELDYASGVVLTLAPNSAAVYAGPFSSNLVYVAPTGGDLSARGDDAVAVALANGTLQIPCDVERYVSVDQGKRLSLIGSVWPGYSYSLNAYVPIVVTVIPCKAT